ncbi:MAG: type II toxin-antitoxin system PemK/MazF family toxin [Actinomycetes bacterium]
MSTAGSSPDNHVSQGDVWLADLDPVRGREQAGRRPVVVISVDALNHGHGGISIVVPVTSTRRPNPIHVELGEGVGGLRNTSYALPEMVRAISQDRLAKRWGVLERNELVQIIRRVRTLTRAA